MICPHCGKETEPPKTPEQIIEEQNKKIAELEKTIADMLRRKDEYPPYKPHKPYDPWRDYRPMWDYYKIWC